MDTRSYGIVRRGQWSIWILMLVLSQCSASWLACELIVHLLRREPPRGVALRGKI